MPQPQVRAGTGQRTPTKFTLPAWRGDLVGRPRLVDALRQEIDRPLFLVLAPAGWGKTTFLVDVARQIGLPTAYARLDAGDRDVRTLLTTLARAIHELAPALPGHTQPAIDALAPGPGLRAGMLAAVGALVEAIEAHVDGLALLMLDDAHVLAGATDAGEVLDALLAARPAPLRLVIAAREPPPLRMARLAAQRAVAGISARELRCTPAEVGEVVQRGSGIALAPDLAARLAMRLDGWVAGVVLAMSSEPAEPRGSLRALAGDPESPDAAVARDEIFAYLADQVLDAAPAQEREFLLGTSVLELLTPESCDGLLGRADSAERLRALEQAGRFVDRFDAPEGRVWRYHDLFRRFLRRRLVAELPERATAWLHAAAAIAERAGDWAVAVERYRDAGDLAAAAALLHRITDTAYSAGAWRALNDALDRLPEAVVLGTPVLARGRARLLTQFGHGREALAFFEAAGGAFEAGGEPAEAALTLAQLALAQRVHADPAVAVATARRAVALAPPENDHVRAVAYHELGTALLVSGEIDAGATCLDEALAAARRAAAPFREAVTLRALHALWLRRGDLDRASLHLVAAVERFRGVGNAAALVDAEANLADIHYLRGEYGEGERVARRAASDAERLGLRAFEASAVLALADILRDAGREVEAAAEYARGLEQAQLGAMRFLTVYALGRLGALEVRLGRTAEGVARARSGLARALEGSAYERALAALELGAAYVEAGEAEAAVPHLDAAIESFETAGTRREAALARLRRVRALYRARRYGDALTGMHQAARAALALDHDAVLVAELGRDRAYVTYMRSRRAGLTWLDRAEARLAAAASGPGAGETGPVIDVDLDGLPRRIEARCLGQTRVLRDGTEIGPRTWAGGLVRTVFCYLAYNGGSEREALRVAFWPEAAEANANVSLHAALFRLRRALYRECLVQREGGWTLDPRVEWWCDASAFRRLLMQTSSLPAGNARRRELLAEAIALYAGPFLPGVDLPWVETQRAQLERLYRGGLRALATESRGAGEPAQAVGWYRRLLGELPYDEAVAEGLMRSLVDAGDRGGARRAYREFARRLRRELGEEPPAQITTLYRYLERPRARPFSG